jgi:hypothetical protein
VAHVEGFEARRPMNMTRHWGVGTPLLAVVRCLAANLACAAQCYEMENATINQAAGGCFVDMIQLSAVILRRPATCLQ